MSLCLVSGPLLAALPLAAFTLAWTHSIEKTRWEEDWQVRGGQLHLVAARVRGSGAGMEAPAGSVLRDGVWHYRPDLPPLPDLTLTHSPPVPAHRICTADGCQPLDALLPHLPPTATVTLRACGQAPGSRYDFAAGSAGLSRKNR